MIQHRGSLNNFFINNAYKLENKQDVDQPYLILNLKNEMCLFFKTTKQQRSVSKKTNAFFVKTFFFLLIMLMFDFITLIKQITVQKGCFFYKNTIKKIRDVSKKHRCFYKNSIYAFLPQHRLKEQ